MFAMHKKHLEPAEVKRLSAELQCCFLIQGWSSNYHPKSVSQWAAELGFIAFLRSSTSKQAAAITVREAALRLKQFMILITEDLVERAQALSRDVSDMAIYSSFVRYGYMVFTGYECIYCRDEEHLDEEEEKENENEIKCFDLYEDLVPS